VQVDFEDFVASRGRALERYAFVLSGDPHRAQDLVQTSLVKAYRRWSWVARADDPDRYVRRILTRSFIDETRRRSSSERPTAEVPDVPGGRDPATVAVVRDQVRRALATLTAQQRAVLVLRHFEGYDDPAIADVLHCSVATVRSHASRGLDRLRQFLTTDEGGPS
jgi:RNA polymerase sigma-70 factor (sigma-E family)